MSSKAEMARGDSVVEVETDMKIAVKSPQAKFTPKLQKQDNTKSLPSLRQLFLATSLHLRILTGPATRVKTMGGGFTIIFNKNEKKEKM